MSRNSVAAAQRQKAGKIKTFYVQHGESIKELIARRMWRKGKWRRVVKPGDTIMLPTVKYRESVKANC